MALCLTLAVPALAEAPVGPDEFDSYLTDLIASLSDVSVRTEDDIYGVPTTRTTGVDPMGRAVDIFEKETSQSVAIALNEDDTYFIRHAGGETTTRLYTYEPSGRVAEKASEAVQPRYTFSGSDLYWGYSYSVGDAEEQEEGLLWDLECGAPTYGSFYGYDDNNMTAKGYAESFKTYVIEMERYQRSARTINANAMDSFFADILAICIDPASVLDAIADSNASVRLAEDEIYNASKSAEEATYYFRRFVNIAHPLGRLSNGGQELNWPS